MLVWNLGTVSSDDARQEFMSVKFSPSQIAVIHSQVKTCLLQFESDDTRLSKTQIRAISAKSSNPDVDRIITNR